jgi:hypothetical protein
MFTKEWKFSGKIAAAIESVARHVIPRHIWVSSSITEARMSANQQSWSVKPCVQIEIALRLRAASFVIARHRRCHCPVLPPPPPPLQSPA